MSPVVRLPSWREVLDGPWALRLRSGATGAWLMRGEAEEMPGLEVRFVAGVAARTHDDALRELAVALESEHDPPEADAEQLVRDHALGKARSVADQADGRPVLGVDTTVVLGGRIYANPQDAGGAERMLEELSGRTHAVVSGLCLLTPGWETVSAVATRVTFRELTPRELASLRKAAGLKP